MFRSDELAAFTIDEFRRNLEGLSDEDALIRVPKEDGGELNAISWVVQHIASHWINVHATLRGQPFRMDALPPQDGTPPAYADALALLDEGAMILEWLPDAPAEAFERPGMGDETIGQFLLRAVLHSWFHIGEINAVRQRLGHPTADFVGGFGGRLEWVPEQR
jgi:hypothetical protein